MPEVTTVLFNVEKPITVTVQSGAQNKSCQVKFGEDEPWMARNRSAVSTRRSLGRGKSIYDPTGSEAADLRLFTALRVDQDGEAFDGFEAAAVIGKLEKIGEIEAVRAGDQFEIRMTALGCELLHILRIPTQGEMIQYSRHSVRVIDQKRSQNVTVVLEPSDELYKKLLVRAVGYADGVAPIIHKAAVISELIGELQAIETEASFF